MQKELQILKIVLEKNLEKILVILLKFLENLHKVSTNLPLRNGKIHGANFAVLRGFNGPGVLVELGFVSNKHDAEIMMSNKYRFKLAEQIAKSIREYLE